MPKARHYCQQCGRFDHVCGPVSKRGLCEDCATANMRANTLAIRGMDEAGYEAWKARWLEGCGQLGRRITTW